VTAGLLLPFKGSHPLSQRFGPVASTFQPPMWLEAADGKPWRSRPEPFAGSVAHAHVHPGVDYSMPIGTKLYAPAAGRITTRSTDPRGGRYVVLRVAGRQTWLYFGHLSGWALPLGASVDAGELVAFSGMSGLATGPHVHVDVRHGQDSPRAYYNFRRLVVGADRAGVDWIVPA